MNAVELKLEVAPRPFWCQAGPMKDLTGVTDKWLRVWADEGRIRTVKFGHARGCLRLYKLADVLELLEEAAATGEPVAE